MLSRSVPMSSSLSVAADARTAADADDDLSASAYFTVQARAEPGVMPRVMELFAKRGLVPGFWHSAMSGNALSIEIRLAGIERGTVDYIARCMRQIVGVDTVLTASD
jgi:acetolactate synthase small subunit